MLLTSIILATMQGDALALDAKGATTAQLMYYAVPITLQEVKPPEIKKETVYLAKPKYATIRLGNGPKKTYHIVLDEPDTSDHKIFIDKNQNGDLTDDGDNAWPKKIDLEGKTQYGPIDVVLNASYGTDIDETNSVPYTIAIYRNPSEPDKLYIFRQSIRAGMVTVNGKKHKAMLVENDCDALFNKFGTNAGHPLWLRIDLLDDGSYSSKNIDIRQPFQLAGNTYTADVSADGSTISLNARR